MSIWENTNSLRDIAAETSANLGDPSKNVPKQAQTQKPH